MAAESAAQLAAWNAPQSHLAVRPGRGQQRPLRTERHTAHYVGVCQEDPYGSPRRDVPQPHRAVSPSRGQQRPIRIERDAAHLAGVSRQFPRTRPGQLAGYYAGLSDEKLDKNDEAKKWLQGLADGGDYDLAAMARFELAQMHDRAGQSDEAVKLYQDLIAKPSVLVPKPVVMLTLAEHYSAKNNAAEATRLYSQIKSEYPDTPIAQQADQELNLLPGKS